VSRLQNISHPNLKLYIIFIYIMIIDKSDISKT